MSREKLDTKGIFLMPMSHEFARLLIEDLDQVALNLGPTAREFYNGLVHGYESAMQGNEGLLYESKD